MSFDVRFAEGVERYLLHYDALTAAERDRVIAGVADELGRDADRFLQINPLDPPHPGYPRRFWYDFVILSQQGELHRFWFACDGRAHVYGVTEVLYVDRVPL